MLPENTGREQELFYAYADKSYNMDLKNKEIKGYCDGQAALAQAIYKILATVRYGFIIYGDDYGTGLIDYLGDLREEAYPLIEREITRAVLNDGRFIAVDDFNFKPRGKILYLTFRVTTRDYSFTYSGEVNFNV